MSRVQIKNENDDWLGTEYWIDKKKVEHVKSVDFRVAVDEVPTFKFETYGRPDIDMSGRVSFDFSPENLSDACLIIREELLKHGDFYNLLLSSMKSAMDDRFWDSRDKNGNSCDIGEEDFFEASELMLKRIIGEG